jgi:hypothetical protein
MYVLYSYLNFFMDNGIIRFQGVLAMGLKSLFSENF